MPTQKEWKNPWAYETEKAKNIKYNFKGKYKENIRKNVSPKSNHEESGKSEKQSHLPLGFCNRQSENLCV